jgi:streptomycin 6-kinase
MERAEGPIALADFARDRDDDASRIICAVLAQLHAPRGQPPAPLVALTDWFAPLRAAAEGSGSEFFGASPLRGSQLDVKRLQDRPRKVDL